jgi:hypothetical protein
MAYQAVHLIESQAMILKELICTVELTEEQVNTNGSFCLDKSWLSGFAL